MVDDHVRIQWKFDRLILKGGLVRRQVLEIPRLCRLDHQDASGPVLLRRLLGDLHAETARVERCAAETRQAIYDVPEYLPLLLEGHAPKLDDEGNTRLHVAKQNQRQKCRQVADARKVTTEIAGHVSQLAQTIKLGLQVLLAPIPDLALANFLGSEGELGLALITKHRPAFAHASLDQLAREECAATVLRHAIELFLCVVTIEGPDLLSPFGLPFLRMFNAQAQTDAVIEPLGQRVIKRRTVHGVRFAPRTTVLQRGVEFVVIAVVRRQDPKATAPDQEGERSLEKTRRVGVKGELVEDNIALLASQVARL